MKRFLLSSAVLLALAAGGTVHHAAADPGPALPQAAAPAPDQPPGPWADDLPGGPGPGFPGRPDGGPGFDPSHRPPPGGWEHHCEDKFSLFARVPDKKLSPDDVKIIATAILLEHGNHVWTVSNVTKEADKSIDFSFATLHGDIIATFAVDPASGHIERID